MCLSGPSEGGCGIPQLVDIEGVHLTDADQDGRWTFGGGQNDRLPDLALEPAAPSAARFKPGTSGMSPSRATT
jgi:hypothetical protein